MTLWGLTTNLKTLFRKCWKKKLLSYSFSLRGRLPRWCSYITMPQRSQVPPISLLILSLANLSASFCIPSRKEKEGQETKWLLFVGFWLLFGKGRPPRGLPPTIHQQKWCHNCQALLCMMAEKFSPAFSSLSSGEKWGGMCLGMDWVNQLVVPTKRPSSYPTCFSLLITNLKDMTYTNSLEQMYSSLSLRTILLHGCFFLILEVPVKLSPQKRIL